MEIAIIGTAGLGFNAAIEACANSNNTILLQSNERGIETVNVDEIKRSPFEPEPFVIKAPPQLENMYSFDNNFSGQKKFRKHNNRKGHKRK